MTNHIVPTDWVPVEACTLPTADQPLRVAEFDNLFAESLTTAEQRTSTSARLSLIGGPGLAGRAQSLADRETACCSFFTFTIRETGTGEIAMDISVPDAHAEVLTALVDRAERVRGMNARGEGS